MTTSGWWTLAVYRFVGIAILSVVGIIAAVVAVLGYGLIHGSQ
jgi:hypothetical protein